MTKNQYDHLHHIYDIAIHSKISDRKAYLFGIACIKRIWDSLFDERLRTAVRKLEHAVENKKEIIIDRSECAFETVSLQETAICDAVRSLFVLSGFGRVYYVFAVSQAVRNTIASEDYIKEHDWQVKTLKHMVKFDENS